MIQAQNNNLKFYYRYKLNENYKSDSKMISNIELSKKWTIFPNEVEEFRTFIRTKDRPTGIIDCEQFDRFTNAVQKSSIVNFKKKLPMYARETLASMPRSQLVEICNAYSISTVSKRPDFLINQILTKQEVYRESDEQRREDTKLKKIEEIAENKINEILDKRCEALQNNERKDLKDKVIETLKKAF